MSVYLYNYECRQCRVFEKNIYKELTILGANTQSSSEVYIHWLVLIVFFSICYCSYCYFIYIFNTIIDTNIKVNKNNNYTSFFLMIFKFNFYSIESYIVFF